MIKKVDLHLFLQFFGLFAADFFTAEFLFDFLDEFCRFEFEPHDDRIDSKELETLDPCWGEIHYAVTAGIETFKRAGFLSILSCARQAEYLFVFLSRYLYHF